MISLLTYLASALTTLWAPASPSSRTSLRMAFRFGGLPFLKLSSLGSSAGALATALFLTPLVPTPAHSQVASFVCKRGERFAGQTVDYATVAVLGSGLEKPLLPHLTSTGVTLSEKCQIVTARLNQSSQAGRLKYLTHGFESGNVVICTASSLGGVCESVLYTVYDDQVSGHLTISAIGNALNADALRLRGKNTYLDVALALDPAGTECGPGREMVDGSCQEKIATPPSCGPGTQLSVDGKTCVEVPGSPICGEGMQLSDDGNSCVIKQGDASDKCGPGMKLSGNTCVVDLGSGSGQGIASQCGEGTQLKDGVCVIAPDPSANCGAGTVLDSNGKCVAETPPSNRQPQSCSAGWSMTPQGCKPTNCAAWQVPTLYGCRVRSTPTPDYCIPSSPVYSKRSCLCKPSSPKYNLKACRRLGNTWR